MLAHHTIFPGTLLDNVDVSLLENMLVGKRITATASRKRRVGNWAAEGTIRAWMKATSRRWRHSHPF